MSVNDIFSDSYKVARTRFLGSCRAAGTRHEAFINPDATGPDGEELAIDTVRIGASTAPRKAVIISGTHGLEGYCGSAIQTNWLQNGGHHAVGETVELILIHALNPWGFAYKSRTTQNNVDLNRNFLDDWSVLPTNDDYISIHPILTGKYWTTESNEEARRCLNEYEKAHGHDSLWRGLAKGQHHRADGLLYGGVAPEWSQAILRSFLTEVLGNAEKIAFVDWHTGLGEYKQPYFLCFNDPDSDDYRRVMSWWPEAGISQAEAEALKSTADYTGLVFSGVKNMAPNADFAGAVVEFGTRSPDDMLYALRLDRWLRFEDSPSSERREELRRDLMDAFCPYSVEWREAVLETSYSLMDRMISGAKQWH